MSGTFVRGNFHRGGCPERAAKSPENVRGLNYPGGNVWDTDNSPGSKPKPFSAKKQLSG